VPVPPDRPSSNQDDDLVSVQKVSHVGEHKAKGETLLSVKVCFEFFLNVAFSYDAVFHHVLHQVRCVPPTPTGRPRGGSITKFFKKNPARRATERR
jgi:hypothetical protein